MNYSEILEALLDIINFLINNGIEILALALSSYIFLFDKREKNKERTLQKFELQNELMKEANRTKSVFYDALELSTELNDIKLFQSLEEIHKSGQLDLPEWIDKPEKIKSLGVEEIMQDLQQFRTVLLTIHLHMFNAKKRNTPIEEKE